MIVYGITMLSEASYSRMMIETAVRSRDWSTRSFTRGVAQFQATTPGLFPTLSKDGPIRSVQVVRPSRLHVTIG